MLEVTQLFNDPLNDPLLLHALLQQKPQGSLCTPQWIAFIMVKEG